MNEGFLQEDVEEAHILSLTDPSGIETLQLEEAIQESLNMNKDALNSPDNSSRDSSVGTSGPTSSLKTKSYNESAILTSQLARDSGNYSLGETESVMMDPLLCEIQADTDEYRKVVQDFLQNGIQVKKVYHVNNLEIKERFQLECAHLQKRKSGLRMNIRDLYHGSKTDLQQVCAQGLDARLAKPGHFGQGIYFSDNPRKCAMYLQDKKLQEGKDQYILRCRVILGDIKHYPPGDVDIYLTREPQKEVVNGIMTFYDSVQGKPNNDFDEFVVYDRSRVLIDYAITYDARIKDGTRRKEAPPTRSHEQQQIEQDRLLAEMLNEREELPGSSSVSPSSNHEHQSQEFESTWQEKFKDRPPDIVEDLCRAAYTVHYNKESPAPLIKSHDNTDMTDLLKHIKTELQTGHQDVYKQQLLKAFNKTYGENFGEGT